MKEISDGPIHGGAEGTVGDTERVLRDQRDSLVRALRRIHDTTGVEDAGRPTSLGYIREQASKALGGL